MELKNKQTELQDQSNSLEATVGMSEGFACRLLMHTMLGIDGPRELLIGPCTLLSPDFSKTTYNRTIVLPLRYHAVLLLGDKALPTSSAACNVA